MINIVVQDGRVYFVINNDNRHLYEDLDGIRFAHPEMTDYINANRYRLERRFFQMQESLNL